MSELNTGSPIEGAGHVVGMAGKSDKLMSKAGNPVSLPVDAVHGRCLKSMLLGKSKTDLQGDVPASKYLFNKNGSFMTYQPRFFVREAGWLLCAGRTLQVKIRAAAAVGAKLAGRLSVILSYRPLPP
jgi:hypothetical protein